LIFSVTALSSHRLRRPAKANIKSSLERWTTSSVCRRSADRTGGVERAGFASLPADSARKAEIEAIMRTDFDRYESERLDREYRALMEAEAVAVDPNAGTPTQPMPAADSRVALCGSVEGQKLVADWERMGGFNTHLNNVQNTVGSLVRNIGDNRAQRAFMERFDRSVPDAARLAVYAEIATGAPTFVQPATKGELALFAQTPAGRAMVDEWGSDAAENVAKLRARAARLTDEMYEDEAGDFWDWFEELGTDTIITIFRRMAG
jgi:hypothetical protein